jgi:hypothetical protein
MCSCISAFISSQLMVGPDLMGDEGTAQHKNHAVWKQRSKKVLHLTLLWYGEQLWDKRMHWILLFYWTVGQQVLELRCSGASTGVLWCVWEVIISGLRVAELKEWEM